jgi:hypothetical protein
MKHLLASLILLCATTQHVSAQVVIDIDVSEKSHTVHPMIQGQGLVYSKEADAIYADGSMAQLYKDIGAGFLRWPGGTVSTMYHWNDLTGVGWVDQWNPSYNTSSNENPSQYMDLDEYILLSKAAGTEPMLGINLSSGMEWDRQVEALQEAIDMLEYCQSQNFDVKYFYLDNETYHEGNGYNKDKDNDGEHWTPQSYAEQINIYAEEIKKLVPDAKIIANWKQSVRDNVGDYTILINGAGDNIDYIDVHYYWKWGVATWDAWKAKTPMENETEWYDGGTYVEEIKFFNKMVADLGKPHIKLASLEWNIAPGSILPDGTPVGHNYDPDHTHFMTALMASEMQMQFIQGGLELASMWTTQWSGSATGEFQVLVNSDDNNSPNPMVYVFELYKHAINGDVVTSTSTDSKIMTTTVIKDDKAFVYLLNKKDSTEQAQFTIEGYDILQVNQARTFSAPGQLSDVNPLSDATSGNYMVDIAGNSLTMIEFSLEVTPAETPTDPEPETPTDPEPETPTEPEVVEEDSKSSGGSMSFISLLALMLFSRRLNMTKS